MTLYHPLAICFKCGAFKNGAFETCHNCMHRPLTRVDYARSLALSDHHMDRDRLHEVAAQMRSGIPVTIDPRVIKRMLAKLDDEPDVEEWRDVIARHRLGDPHAVEVVWKFWRLMNSNDFSSVAEVLSEKFVLEWPQSRERIRGAENFARMNAEYPAAGPWSFTVNRMVGGNQSASSVVTVTDGKATAQVISFFIVRMGKIGKLVEYWPEPYDAPAHRSHLVERLD